MNTIAPLIEPLEPRIAPAGVVVATLDETGALILATAASNVSVLLEHFPDGAWLLEGESGSTVQFNGGAPQTQVFFKGFTGDVSAQFSGGANDLIIKEAMLPKNLTMQAGVGGANSLRFVDGGARGNVTLNGSEGSEDINLSGYQASIGGNLILNGGNGDTNVMSTASFLTIRGKLSQSGDNGSNSLIVQSGTVKIGGELKFDGFNGTSNVVALTPAQLTIGGDLTLKGGADGGNFDVSPMGVLRVAKAVNISTGDGNNSVKIGAGSISAILGSVSIETGYSAGAKPVSLVPSALLQVAGSVMITQPFWDSTTTIHSDVVKIGGTLALNLGTANSGTTKTVNIDTNNSLRVKGDLTISGADHIIAATLVSRGAFAVGGNLKMETLANTDKTNFTVNAVAGKIGKDLALTAAEGDYTTSFNCGKFTVGGDFHLEDQANASKSVTGSFASLSVKKNMNVSFPAGNFLLSLGISGALNVGKNLSFVNDFGGGGGNNATLFLEVGMGRIGGNLFLNHSGANANVELAALKAPLTIGGTLTTNFDETTSVISSLSGLNVNGDFSVSSSNSNDSFTFDDLNVKGTTIMFAGGGSDALYIETVATNTRRATSFGRMVDIQLDGGNDTVLIGVNGDATRKATFLTPAMFDGGLAENDAITFANAVFKAGSTAINFETGP